MWYGTVRVAGKNLTRDYKFKELYCSTLFDSELKIGERYNKEAISFQFDFLNDDLEKLPKGLIEAFEQNKPIVFFLNPPYGTGASGVGKSKESGTTTTTIVNSQMKEDNIGGCSENLYAQFLYRINRIKVIYNLTNCHIALFSPTLFLTGSSWAVFRKTFLGNFNLIDSMQFKASEFADVSDTWGISFSLWNCGESVNKNTFKYKLVENINGNIEIIGSKYVYNIDGQKTASEWAKEKIHGLKTNKTIALTSGIGIAKEEQIRGSIFDNAIGYFLNGGNNVDKNWSHCALFSWNYSNGHGHGLNGDNFTRCTALFSARKLIEKNWINSKDEYLAPNEQHEKYNEFVNDSVIYSLFHSASNQSSLRQVEYKEKLWDIKNEFFWMSKQDIMDWANEYNMDEIYEDAKTSEERYVYKYIQEHKKEFSQEALDVLNKAIELTKKSFKYRQLFADEHPEYQLEKCWDAGFYQLKAIWKEYMKDDFEKFKKSYKALSDKMRPMVYSIGFLK